MGLFARYNTLALMVILLASACASAPIVVLFEGNSMYPAIKDGDRLLLNPLINDLKRGDIISFKYPRDKTKFYVKRIIGLPGEAIEIKEGKTFINDVEITEDYVDPELHHSSNDIPRQIIAANSYFVMGDNRDNSSDSRIWGAVDKSLITGKYLSTYAKKETT